MATTESLLTAEEYFCLPDPGVPTELVEGQIVLMNVPGYRHGAVCSNIVYLLRSYLAVHPIGRVLCNDSGVVTQRGPDSVRGPDVSFYSHARMPKGPLPKGYPNQPAELVFEVLSPDDRPKKIAAKAAEFLRAGVLIACVADPDSETIDVHRPDQPVVTLTADQEFTFPDLLPGFAAPVAKVFE